MAKFTFPVGGKNIGTRSSQQPPDTSRDMNNVRAFYDGRLCGGQRPGLDKWGGGTQIGSAEQPVVAICSVSTVI